MSRETSRSKAAGPAGMAGVPFHFLGVSCGQDRLVSVLEKRLYLRSASTSHCIRGGSGLEIWAGIEIGYKSGRLTFCLGRLLPAKTVIW